MSISEKKQAVDEIASGIDLIKCQQCSCMQETLDQINQALPKLPSEEVAVFEAGISGWLDKMRPIRYSCLGCDHCYAGAAQNAFTNAFPQVADSFGLSCEVQVNNAVWPPVVGEYIVTDPQSPIAVVTLASLDLPKQIADREPRGLAIVGKLETENIGIDKLVKNVIANPKLCFLIIAGTDAAGHQSGQTIQALAENGIDSTGRVIESNGKRPVLKNVSVEDVEAFRKQVKIINLLGCEDVERIVKLIEDLALLAVDTVEVTPCGCSGNT